MTARYADHDEVFEVGDAFYIPPGHVPVKNEPGTEFLWFSPSEELRTVEAVMIKRHAVDAGRLNVLSDAVWSQRRRRRPGPSDAVEKNALSLRCQSSNRSARSASDLT